MKLPNKYVILLIAFSGICIVIATYALMKSQSVSEYEPRVVIYLMKRKVGLILSRMG